MQSKINSAKDNKSSEAGYFNVDIKAIKRAITEDAPGGDVTSMSLIPRDKICVGRLISKQDLVISGQDVFNAVFKTLDPEIEVVWKFEDGFNVCKGSELAVIRGHARSVLLGERVALNYIQHMCAVATLTSEYVKAVSGTSTKILDTRKTIPGFRALDKYAVRCGGGVNHRDNLSEMVLIKENHISLAGGVSKAINKVRNSLKRTIPLIVEVSTIYDIKEACSEYPDRLLLDNMTPSQIKRAMTIIPEEVKTEASGGITLKNVLSYAKTGVNFISVGALTHSAKAADLSFLIEKYIKAPVKREKKSLKKAKSKDSGPRKFITSDGYLVLVGRNDRENDEITFRKANGRDLWLHASGFPGSHVVVKLPRNTGPSRETVKESAMLALKYSKAAKDGKGKVTYCHVKNVKKTKGMEVGEVLVRGAKSIFVTIDNDKISTMKQSG
ncbi:MAG TPA: carboxylating nicotinate-nucleotide diphosphorylase [Nitrospinota bacterium]|nr:carboxylating nicotinate-nucleotide diphosphorylase [Nitrospinota bacterium]|tara:strand:- start:127422 stop:128744 length:1323 start_codon:yes stop_codon:yes gene_type:complete